jgi:prepilin-type N-terminal cleavage/methylation domain-containing protein
MTGALKTGYARLSGAFTLIELLVVIAVLAVLASILLPALSQAREEGRTTICRSNLRSLSTAVYTYAESNDGWFPQWGYAHGGGAAGAAWSWINTMKPEYGEVTRLLRCPSDLSRHWSQPLNGRLRSTSYATNFYVTSAAEDNPLFDRDGHGYNRLDWILWPARTIFFCELAESGPYALADHVHPENWAAFYPNERRHAATQLALGRHRDAEVYGFIDGHAERLTFEKTFQIQLIENYVIEWLYNKYDPTVAR